MHSDYPPIPLKCACGFLNHKCHVSLVWDNCFNRMPFDLYGIMLRRHSDNANRIGIAKRTLGLWSVAWGNPLREINIDPLSERAGASTALFELLGPL